MLFAIVVDELTPPFVFDVDAVDGAVDADWRFAFGSVWVCVVLVPSVFWPPYNVAWLLTPKIWLFWIITIVLFVGRSATQVGVATPISKIGRVVRSQLVQYAALPVEKSSEIWHVLHAEFHAIRSVIVSYLFQVHEQICH